MANNGTTTTSIDSNFTNYYHYHDKRKRSHARIYVPLRRPIMYFIGFLTLSVPYFLISFSPLFYQSSNIIIDDRNNKNNVFASVLAGSKVSSSSSSLLPTKRQLHLHQHHQQNHTYTLENPPNYSPYNILHTVMTRFMVGQSAAKYELAKARYLLFETFCWPTMKYQTNQNFYWLVLVDPGLHPSIINDMRTLLNDVPTRNAYMVLTNNTAWSADGVGVGNATSYGVGLQTIVQQYASENLDIITGNSIYLLHALDWMKQKEEGQKEEGMKSRRKKNNPVNNEIKPIMVIETLLDADDGMNNHGIEWIQNTAIERTKEYQHKQQQQLLLVYHNATTNDYTQTPHVPTLNNSWWFLCGTDHIEWHNRDIFKLTNEEYAEFGVTSGLAGLRQSPYFCTSAGFTRIGITTTTITPSMSSTQESLSSSSFSFPKDAYSNHALAFYFPECTSTDTDTTTAVINNGNYSHCWRREFPGEVFILKSRTITSDSMDHLNPRRVGDYRDVAWLNKTDYPLLINATEKMWNILRKEYSINRTLAWETSVYIFDNRQLILRQNKESRCSPGFPCYKEARRNLLRMQKYWTRQTKANKKKLILDKVSAKKKLELLASGPLISNIDKLETLQYETT